MYLENCEKKRFQDAAVIQTVATLLVLVAEHSLVFLFQIHEEF